MGVYISGIKMPEKDGVYTIRIWGTGQIERLDGYHSFLLSGSKAVNIPPHGRLVDLDKIENEIARLAPEDYTTGGIRLVLDYAPTIIPPAEET